MKKIIGTALAVTMLASIALPAFATGVLLSSDPVGGTCSVGESGPTLTAYASPQSGGTLSYQWYDSYGAAIPGATGASFAPPTNTSGDFGYYVTVTESVDGTVVATDTSGLANVTVKRDAEKPKITANPSSASCSVGQTVTLHAKAEVATGTLSYRWYCYTSESAVGGATEIYTASSPSYAPPTDKASSVYYYCRITNTDETANGETKVSVNTATALVTVRNSGDAEAPEIYSQPTDFTCMIGDEAQISVGATVSDGGEISYQWYSSANENGSDAVAIDGANTAYFRPVTDAETSMYVYCILTNTNDTVTGNTTTQTMSEVVLFEVRKPDIVGAVWDGGSSGRFAGGSGTAADPFVMETAGQLAHFSTLAAESSLTGMYFVLGEDIILNDGTTSNLWTPVGTALVPFEGIFDGRGNTVSGLSVSGADVAGLFGEVRNAHIRNLNVSGDVSGKAAGGIVGAAENTVIENCSFGGTVNGSSLTGGIAATVFGGAVSNCVSVGLPVVGTSAGYALTDSSFDTADSMIVLARRARAKAGLALWTVDENGMPVLSNEISEGADEDIVSGELSPQSGVSGTNAIAQMSVTGVLSGNTVAMWVNPAELSVLIAEAVAFAAEDPALSVYVYLDGGNSVSGETGVELILSEDEVLLMANAGSQWSKSYENGIPCWTETGKGKGVALTADFGEVNATWNSESVSDHTGAARIFAGFTSQDKSELASVDIGGFSNGTWRVRSDAFAGKTSLVAVVLSLSGHTKYLVAVNAEGFAEYTSKGISATYLFFDENNIPEEYKEVIVETTTETEPSGQPGQDDPNSTKPSPKKGSTALVAVCAIVVSVGGAVIYGIASGSLGGKKK